MRVAASTRLVGLLRTRRCGAWEPPQPRPARAAASAAASIAAIGGSSSIGVSTIGELSAAAAPSSTRFAATAAASSGRPSVRRLRRMAARPTAQPPRPARRSPPFPRELHHPRGVRVRGRHGAGGGGGVAGRLALSAVARRAPRSILVFLLDVLVDQLLELPRGLLRSVVDVRRRRWASRRALARALDAHPRAFEALVDRDLDRDAVALLDVGELGALLVEHDRSRLRARRGAGSGRRGRAPPRPR